MIGMNNKKDSKDEPSFFQRIHKFVSSAAVFAVLLPSISSIGLVQAAELETEEPPIEETVPQADPEVEEETEVDNADPDVSLPDAAAEVEESDNTPPLPDETTPEPSEVPDEIVEEPQEELETASDDASITQIVGIIQENLIYENGRVSLINQEPGTNIAAVLPNGNVIYKTVPYHGTWQPNQIIAPDKVYPGDELEIFTYSGNERGESAFLTVIGEGEERPDNQQDIRYGWQHFGFRPTQRDTRATYYTEPFFTVEMIFPNGEVFNQIAGILGQTSFSFGDNYTPTPGDEFTVRIFDRNGNLIDLNDPNLFPNLTTPNQSSTTIYGEIPVPETHTVTIDPNGGTINEEYTSTEVTEGETYSLPALFRSELNLPGYTLVGFAVEGTLLDSEGNSVSEIPISTSRNYTPETDVTLSAIWEETTGGFRALIYDDVPSTQRDRYTVTLIAEDGTEYPLTSNQYGPDHRTWRIEDVPNGTYTLVIDGYNISDGEKFGQNDTTSDFIVNDDGTATVDLEFVDNKSTTFIRYRIYGEPIPEVETYPLGIEVRDLNGARTDDIGITVEDEDGEIFAGSYNQYNQWRSEEELPEGLYTITLDTPEGTLAEINDTVASQHAESTDEENVFKIRLNAENQGNLSAVFAAFRLVEEPVEIESHLLGVEVRGLNNLRTDDVEIVVTNEDDEVFSGDYNEYLQWYTDEELPVGVYTITLTTPEGTIAEINDTVPTQSAEATDEDNVFTILVNAENRGNLSAVFAAFRLVEEPVEVATYPLGIEIRDLDGRRTDDVGIKVTNEDGEVFTGSYNQYLQWLTDEDLPEGLYTITLTTPEGIYAEINDTVASQHATPTDEENIFTILVNAENQGNLSAVFGAFKLIERPTEPEETFEDIERTESIEFVTEKRENPNLPLGQTRVIQEGVNGTRTITERVYYVDGVEVRREIIDEKTTPAVTQIIEVGTKTNIFTIINRVIKTVKKVVQTIFGFLFR